MSVCTWAACGTDWDSAGFALSPQQLWGFAGPLSGSPGTGLKVGPEDPAQGETSGQLQSGTGCGGLSGEPGPSWPGSLRPLSAPRARGS